MAGLQGCYIYIYVYLYISLEAQLPTYWVPVLKTLYNYILSVTQGHTIWVPGHGVSGCPVLDLYFKPRICLERGAEHAEQVAGGQLELKL